MSTTQTSNTKWHEYQIDHQYVDNIANNLKIRVSTTKDNYYIFTRESTGSINWQYRINDLWQEDGGVRKTIRIEIIDDAINFFYNQLDPITELPIEIPIAVTLN